ncbi:TetR family transcriptional regulator C-terminal domain-containing protein [Aestuariivirga litoralis]|uniref:TetR family transcriptional regulator C-terminal domain-containing protein n=1 Tax=Aestuariivirga litoralis TaxID=2650924 RepID=UPI0018C4BD23|nr:TetR family transcriptional regulator C-terminal domain-containing protein [Aestuariivirga litoralis]MBG1233151.1 TetR family transcriptional regulator [Aestuariivirga litoralis]
MPKSKAKPQQETRIQAQNRAVILSAALEAFSAYGFRGATVDQIAEKAGLSKPNLLYYFRRKEDIYVALLEQTLDEWLAPLRLLNADGEPIAELTRYISEKLDMSFAGSKASRLFANEILHGAPHVGAFLKGPLRKLVEEKSTVIRRWISEGRIKPVDPEHFIFAIWAVTQHYADFSSQVESVLGAEPEKAKVKQSVLDILLRGLKA